MSDPLVLYLRTDTRALVCIAPPGASLPPTLIANTIQMTTDEDTWRTTYQPARQALAGGQDLVVHLDGTTASVAHAANPAEQAYAVLAAYLANSAPSAAETVQAVKTLIRVLRMEN